MLRPGHHSYAIWASKEQVCTSEFLFDHLFFILIYKTLFLVFDTGILVLLMFELQVAIMFLTSKICCVSLDTVRVTVLLTVQVVSGVKPGMKKCRCGKGTMFMASVYRSAFSWPENHSYVATLHTVADTRWLQSPKQVS